MNNQKLQNFIDLVAFDQHLIALESTIALSEKKLQNLRNDFEKIQKRVEEKTAEKKELKKQFDLQELHVKDLQDKETRQVSVIERAKNSKECDAASKELEHIRAERTRQEKKLMQLWNHYQATEKEIEQMHVESLQKTVQIEAAIIQEDETLQKTRKDLETQQTQRVSKIDLLPQEWVVFYENMRGKVLNPVVPVSQDSCSACFYSVSSRDLQILRQNGLVPCKDCYRYLYIEDTNA